MGDVRLAGHVVDVLDGGVPLGERDADLVGRDRLDAESGLGLSEGSAQVHQPGLGQLLHADVVFCRVIFGLGPQGGGGVGHEDVAAALRHAAPTLGTSEIHIQLLEELSFTHIHGLSTGWVHSSRETALLPPQGESVAGIFGNRLHVTLAGFGGQGVKVGAHGERQVRRGHLLFRGALHSFELKNVVQ